MSEHTKGPWYGADKPIFGWWTIYSNHSIGGTECLNGRQAIATIPAASKKNDLVYAEMFAANARLIAAAPELLESLEAMVDAWNMVCDAHGWDHGHIQAQVDACKAIAKSKGQP